MVIVDLMIDLLYVDVDIIVLVICSTYEWLIYTASGCNMLVLHSTTCDDDCIIMVHHYNTSWY